MIFYEPPQRPSLDAQAQTNVDEFEMISYICLNTENKVIEIFDDEDCGSRLDNLPDELSKINESIKGVSDPHLRYVLKIRVQNAKDKIVYNYNRELLKKAESLTEEISEETKRKGEFLREVDKFIKEIEGTNDEVKNTQ